MKKFIVRTLIFIMPLMVVYVFLMFVVVPKIVIKEMGPSTRSQITSSFRNAEIKNYDLLILGNSRMYRGINPDLMRLNSFNFSHDNDTYNQLYFKLKFVLKRKKKIKYLLLGVDYFQFSYISGTRNYVYSDLLDKDYRKDYPYETWFSNFLSETQLLDFSRIKFMKNVFEKTQNSSIYLKDNGQYIRPGKATMSNISDDSIQRLPLQISYFEQIIKECKKNKIKVILCMMPARDLALKNYSKKQINEFDHFIMKYKDRDVELLNFTYDKHYFMEDYTDVKHLSQSGADKFTRQLNDSINEIVNRNNFY